MGKSTTVKNWPSFTFASRLILKNLLFKVTFVNKNISGFKSAILISVYLN